MTISCYSENNTANLLPNSPLGPQDLEVLWLFSATLVLLNICSHCTVLENFIFIVREKSQIGVTYLVQINCFRNNHKVSGVYLPNPSCYWYSNPLQHLGAQSISHWDSGRNLHVNVWDLAHSFLPLSSTDLLFAEVALMLGCPTSIIMGAFRLSRKVFLQLWSSLVLWQGWQGKISACLGSCHLDG